MNLFTENRNFVFKAFVVMVFGILLVKGADLNDNNEYGFNSFPISQLQRHLPMGNLPMEINMDKFEDIYMLTLHVGGFKL